MYNLIHGQTPHAAMLLALLGFTKPGEQIARLRDCYVDADSNVVVFTRTGADPQYADANLALEHRPGWLRTERWEIDGTYAKFVYSPPPGQEQTVRVLGDTGARTDPTQRHNDFLADMGAANPKPSTRAAIERLRPTMEAVHRAVASADGAAVVLADEDSNWHKDL